MTSTDRKASSGMLKLIAIIFVVALGLAGVYFFFLTPESPQQGQPSPHAIDQRQ